MKCWAISENLLFLYGTNKDTETEFFISFDHPQLLENAQHMRLEKRYFVLS